MPLLRVANLAVAFLLELAMLAAFAVWGFSVPDSPPTRGLLGVGTPVLAAVLWRLLLAATSSRRLPMPWLVLVKLLLYGLASAALLAVSHPASALLLASLAAVTTGLAYLWGQEEVVSRPGSAGPAGPAGPSR